MNILIADDHAIVRKGLVQLLREEFVNIHITEAADSTEVYQVLRDRAWDVILLDISMPGRNGVEVLKQLRAEGIRTPILMLSMHPEEQYALRVLKAGASGFLKKDAAPEELITAIHRVLAGRKYITASLAELMAEEAAQGDRGGFDALSDREMEVFLLLAAGRAVSEIATEMSLSVNTVSTYRARILEKLVLKSNADIIRYAIDHRQS
ncbi:MAG: response regulator transcription factor [Bacteroidetes bacterium]|nr:response regulator transcription factor [Bacteroidota bacterium]